MSPFVVCPKCRRHVKRGDAACPFCSPRPTSRASLGLTLAVVGLGASMIACYGPPPRDEEPESGSTTTTAGAGGCGAGDAATCDDAR